MGYECGGAEVGLVEKASKIALKNGVVYDSRAGIFNGDSAAVARAQAQLDSWKDKQSIKQRAERSAW